MAEIKYDSQLKIEDNKKEHLIKRGNFFFLFVMVYSIAFQLIHIKYPDILFEYITLFLPCVIYLIIFKEDRKYLFKHFKLLNIQSIIIILFIWALSLPIRGLILEIYNALFTSKLSDVVTNSIVDEKKISVLFIFLSSAITPALTEEFLFRGVILSTYKNKKILTTAIINGIMFGMLHLNSFQFSHVVITGIICVYIFYATKSFLAPFLFHLTNNGMAVLSIVLNSSDNVSKATNSVTSTTTSTAVQTTTIGQYALLVVGAILGVYLCIKYIKRLAKINNVDLSELDKEKTSKERVIDFSFISSVLIFIGISILISVSVK